VQLGHAVADLRTPEFDYGFVETPVLAEVEEQLAAVHILHDENDVVFGLEVKVEFHEAIVVGKVHDVLLGLGAFKILAFDDHVFLEALHGLEFVVLLLHQQHLPERAAPQHLVDLEVGDLD